MSEPTPVKTIKARNWSEIIDRYGAGVRPPVPIHPDTAARMEAAAQDARSRRRSPEQPEV